ncbi:hypothetical protein TNCT_572511 [Trichonephila clavata]|uniref:Uncharacterized protein n=1 Tax=Trichonephila clavata TaxID=2740835 RepID=A0A8X6IBC7_TRICU|nr:hypothetical protein TNCT_572511 [Trichonephila clavata]
MTKCQTMLRVIKELECTMSFLVFIAFCRITLQAFSMGFQWKKGSNDIFRSLHISITVIEMIFLFVVIAFLADLVQRRFLMKINVLLCDESRFKLLEMDNVHYNRMLQDNKLTAWDMCVINRTLVLTFMASLATYSILITDQINA